MSNQHYCLSGLISLQPSPAQALLKGRTEGEPEQQKTSVRLKRDTNMHLIYSWIQQRVSLSNICGSKEFKGHHMVDSVLHSSVILHARSPFPSLLKKQGVVWRMIESVKKKNTHPCLRLLLRGPLRCVQRCAWARCHGMAWHKRGATDPDGIMTELLAVSHLCKALNFYLKLGGYVGSGSCKILISLVAVSCAGFTLSP